MRPVPATLRLSFNQNKAEPTDLAICAADGRDPVWSFQPMPPIVDNNLNDSCLGDLSLNVCADPCPPTAPSRDEAAVFAAVFAAADARLRLVATSDLHMALLGYDYAADAPRAGGLARAASLIRALRAAVPGSLLLDNGDLLQGDALGDWLAETRSAAHPVIAAMNALGYDAATPGNHDTNHGLAYLRRAVAGAAFPFVCSNLRLLGGEPLGPDRLLIDRALPRAGGGVARVRIGVIGCLPPQSLDWDLQTLSGRAEIDDICDTVARLEPALRAGGADLVIALCHSGLGPTEPTPGLENAAAALPQVARLDAIIAGHTHQLFPDANPPALPWAPGVDAVAGRVHGVPVVQPGHLGGHVGVIDLALCADGAGWRVAGDRVAARPVTADCPPQADIEALAAPAHRALRRHLAQPVGWTETPLSTALALVTPSAALGLVAAAICTAVRSAVAGTALADLPVLAAVPPYKSGGRGGPGCYTHVPAGRLTLRALDDLYPYPNRLACAEISGAELADWLEHSASVYARLRPGGADQPLLDPAFPGFECDAVHGVSAAFDLTQPARFDRNGRLLAPAARRLRSLTWQGRAVQPAQRFLIATSDYRLATRGLAGRPGSRVFALRARDALRSYLAAHPRVAPAVADWQLLPAGGASALFDTSPAAVAHLDHDPRLESVSLTEAGFLRLRLHL